MIYLSLVIALALGYLIGVMQHGIHIHKVQEEEIPDTYNKSIGISTFTDYYDETKGETKF